MKYLNIKKYLYKLFCLKLKLTIKINIIIHKQEIWNNYNKGKMIELESYFISFDIDVQTKFNRTYKKRKYI